MDTSKTKQAKYVKYFQKLKKLQFLKKSLIKFLILISSKHFIVSANYPVTTVKLLQEVSLTLKIETLEKKIEQFSKTHSTKTDTSSLRERERERERERGGGGGVGNTSKPKNRP